jgi:CHAD domain-containing protein
LRQSLAKDKPVSDVKKLLKRLEKVGTPRTADRSAWRGALALTLLRRAKKLKIALEDAGALYAPERIHAVRVSIKKLRYALEIADDAGHAGLKPVLKALKREQDRLGHLHDREMLLKRVRDAEGSGRSGTRSAELGAYADALERDCRQLHAEFVEARETLFECIDEVRHNVVPALTTGRMRQARVADTQGRPRASARKRA